MGSDTEDNSLTTPVQTKSEVLCFFLSLSLST